MYESDDPDGDYVIPFQPKTVRVWLYARAGRVDRSAW